MEGRDPECPIELGDRAGEIMSLHQAAFCLSRFGCGDLGGKDPASLASSLSPLCCLSKRQLPKLCEVDLEENAQLPEHQDRRVKMR